ncbi:MAG: ATP-binding protein [Verrucomicrobiae bacterium]|nr:ATP-binding protein [Verrucomicrobiae bacterium]
MSTDHNREDDTAALVRAELIRCGAPRRHVSRGDLNRAGERSRWAETLGRARERCDGRGAILALIGPRGTGKTQIAVEVLRLGAGARRTVRYAAAMDVFLDVRATMNGRGRSEADAVAEWCRPSLLVIDEIQERKGSGFEAGLLTHIIDRRYGAMRDTVIIANVELAELGRLVGDSAASRINETGGIIRCDWPSFRG